MSEEEFKDLFSYREPSGFLITENGVTRDVEPDEELEIPVAGGVWKIKGNEYTFTMKIPELPKRSEQP